jgi:hypothetical protein
VQHVVAGGACCLNTFFPHLAELAVDEVTDHGDYVLVAARTPGTGRDSPVRDLGADNRASPCIRQVRSEALDRIRLIRWPQSTRIVTHVR